ncbi:MAG: sigma-70 family RNA polymerase sigma factor [Chloroflexi bacterium]|nr:sigma-70 family RNA polymerase sigma factor [Chloroflexota bacterium]
MDENELVAASRDGSVSAFNQLVVAYQEAVYNVAYRVLGDREAAADATQEAFLSAYQGIKGFRGGSFRAWLFRIVTNACYDLLRTRKRRPAVSLEELASNPSGAWSPLVPGESPDDYVLRRELNREIQAGLCRLPPEQRLAVVLCDVQGFSYEEIALVTRTSVGTVKSRLSRGREHLRDYLLSCRELLSSGKRLTR